MQINIEIDVNHPFFIKSGLKNHSASGVAKKTLFSLVYITCI